MSRMREPHLRIETGMGNRAVLRVGDPESSGLPVTVPGDVTLVSRPGMCIGIGGLRAYRDGFLFHLVHSTLVSDAAAEGASLFFRGRSEHERGNLSRLVVRYADGRMADSALMLDRPGEHGLFLSTGGSFGSQGCGWRRSHDRWLAVPLPVSGPVSFEIYLPAEPGLSGSASLDSSPIISAAARAQVLWPPADELR